MAKINTYPTDNTPVLTDEVVGTKEATGDTVNFPLANVLALPLQSIGSYINNAAALAAGLPIGKIYLITGTDQAGIVHA